MGLPGDDAPDREQHESADNAPHGVQIITSDWDRVLIIGSAVAVHVGGATADAAVSRLRAWREGEHLLLDTPAGVPPDALGPEGAPWLLRVQLHGYVAEADTTFLGQDPQDPHAVRVSFPGEIRLRSQREHYRAPVMVYAKYGMIGSSGVAEPLTPTTMIDLSLGGCAFHAEAQVAPGSRVLVTVASSPNETPCEIESTVQRCVPEPGGYVIGVAFDELNMNQRPVLVRILGTDLFRSDTIGPAD